MAHARPQPGRGQAARHGPRPRSRPACLQAPEFSPCPYFWEPGQPRENPVPSLLSTPATSQERSFATEFGRVTERPSIPAVPASLAITHPRSSVGSLSRDQECGNGDGPAARAPQSWALRPGSRPGCPPAGQTPFYFWFLPGASPRRAGQLLPAGRPRLQGTAPLRPAARNTAREGGHAWSCAVEGNEEQTN